VANSYYTRQNDYKSGNIARGDSVQGDFQAVEVGFDKLPIPAANNTGFNQPLTVLNGVNDNHVLTKAQVKDLIDLAGGFTALANRKNKLINGGFDVWRRGVSFTGTGFTADRWRYDTDTNDTVNFSRTELTPGQAILGDPTYCMTIDVVAGSTGLVNNFHQKIESVRTLSGSTLTISGYVKASSAGRVVSQAVQNFGSGGSTAVVTTAGFIDFTTNWQRFSLTVETPSIAGKTLGTNHFLDIIFGLPAHETRTYYFAQLQVERGSIATDFEKRFIGEEFVLASRYFFPAGNGAVGAVSSSSTVVLGLSFPQQMIQNPVISIRDTPKVWIIKTGSIVTASSPTITSVSPSNLGLSATISGFSGLTANDAVVSTSSCFNIDAEI
jgi:hypothetical protein